MNMKPTGSQKSFAIFFADTTRFLQTLSRFGEGGGVEGMTLDEFKHNFTYVGTFGGENADDVFKLLQDGRGGLGVEVDQATGAMKEETTIPGMVMQDLLIGKIGHTSMSQGDVAVDLATGKIMLCAASGWDEMIITGRRSPRVAGGR